MRAILISVFVMVTCSGCVIAKYELKQTAEVKQVVADKPPVAFYSITFSESW